MAFFYFIFEINRIFFLIHFFYISHLQRSMYPNAKKVLNKERTYFDKVNEIIMSEGNGVDDYEIISNIREMPEYTSKTND